MYPSPLNDNHFAARFLTVIALIAFPLSLIAAQKSSGPPNGKGRRKREKQSPSARVIERRAPGIKSA